MKRVTNSINNEELIFQFKAIRLEKPEEDWLEESSSLVAFYDPTTRLLDPSETPQRRYFPYQLQPSFNPVLNHHSQDRPLFPFPGSSNSQSYYYLPHPNPLPYCDGMFDPQSCNVLPNHLSLAPDHENVVRPPITRLDESRWLINKVRWLKRTRAIESNLEIQYIIHGFASNPISLRLSACNRNGSSALQELIKTVEKPCTVTSELAQAIAIEFSNIAFDASGRHVIRECFMNFSPHDNENLCIEMVKHCLSLATRQAGCILLNECIPYMCSAYKNQILEQIALHCQFLAQDYYGTHVVQEAITRRHPTYTPIIVANLRSIILNLSTQQAGSHLVEKCLGCSSTKQIVKEELLRLSSLQLRQLACHRFANFLIQKAISLTPNESSTVQNLTRTLRRALHPILKDLQSNHFGHNICKEYKKTQHVLLGQY